MKKQGGIGIIEKACVEKKGSGAMKLRKATLADGPAVVALYREAQAFLAAQGIGPVAGRLPQ